MENCIEVFKRVRAPEHIEIENIGCVVVAHTLIHTRTHTRRRAKSTRSRISQHFWFSPFVYARE